MFIKTQRSTAGLTIIETMIALTVSLLITAGVVSSFLGCGRTMLSLSYYTQLNQNAQRAIDQMTREIRGVACLTNFGTLVFSNSPLQGFHAITNSLTFIPQMSAMTNTNAWITYFYNNQSGLLTRSQYGTNQTLLSNLTFLNFQLFQRNVTNDTFCPIPTSNAAQTKLVQVNWTCSDNNPLFPSESYSLESAKIVIRAK
jgi:type II secretory pathway component PulJ